MVWFSENAKVTKQDHERLKGYLRQMYHHYLAQAAAIEAAVKAERLARMDINTVCRDLGMAVLDLRSATKELKRQAAKERKRIK